ncbi:MAG: hypothetical protein WAN61_01950 [Minisyncoccia bacterium]
MQNFKQSLSTNKVVLLVVGILSFFASVFGWFYTFSGNASSFSFAFFPLGIFTWDDGMVIGTFIFLGCIFLWYKNNSTLTGLFFSIYTTIRSAGETIYNLNAQFSSISRPWESCLPGIATYFHLKLVELFVIGQIFAMVLCVISFMIFLSYLKKYLISK